MRVGIGQDSHKFTDGKELVLGGKIIFGHMGLSGNSDGDVVYHALCNAIGTACGKGSLSLYSDPMCKKGITDSAEYVKHISKGLHINNVSISIECKTPKIEPHVNDMKAGIAKLLKIKKSQVGISATTGEGMTSFGRGEGIQVFCIVSLK